MKVLDLQCSHQHAFEGWFGSEDDFQAQLARGLVECPLCADNAICKMPSAPRLNLGALSGPGHEPSRALSKTPEEMPRSASVAASAETGMGVHQGGSPAAQAAFLKALRHVVAHTENVGDRFAAEARAMHYGDAEARSIRGQASPQEAVELMDEGIDVMPLPMPAALKETLQ